MTDLPTQPISPPQRQGTVDRLCAHFAADHIETDEFERRLDLAYAAQTANELILLEQDLPDLRPGAEAEIAAPQAVVPPAPQGVVVDTTRSAPERDLMMAVMGGTERTGTWTPAKHQTVLSMMGGAGLDFREATFAAPEITLTVFSIMGSVEIIVPPGVHVESNGIAIMGGFGASQHGTQTNPESPVIRIKGLVIMGGVDIKVRLPKETEREARKRIKEEKKAAKKGILPPGATG